MYTEYREGDENIDLGGNMLPKVGFSAFPNPANTQLTLATSPVVNITAKVDIFIQTGVKVMTMDWNNAPELTINIAGLNEGVYLAKIQAGNDVFTLKFIIVR
jgi:hypothetical protein